MPSYVNNKEKYKLTCRKCNNKFSMHHKQDGKKYNLHNRKFCLQCSPFRCNNKRSLYVYPNDPNFKYCGQCKRTLSNDNFHKSPGRILYSYCKDCSKLYAATKLYKFKSICVDYKGGKCIHCGFNKCIAALQFHHRNPSEKDFSIHECNGNFTDKVRLELDKCDLVCANCHFEIHYQITISLLEKAEIYVMNM